MYIKKILLAIVTIGLVVSGLFAYYVYHTLLTPNTAFNNEKAIVYIPSNANFDTVVEELTPLLKDMNTFRAVAEKKKYVTRIKGGKYEILKDMTNNDIITVLRSKNKPVRVSFNNQESLASLAGRVAVQIEADSISLLEAFTNKKFLKENDFNQDTALGMYIANSYEFFWNTSAEKFRDKMLREYDKFWNAKRLSKAKKIGLIPKQVIALAAIVQKETVKNDERPRVAGVYINRYKKGMLLQADPTVVYVVKTQTGVQLKRVLNKHLKIEDPYNTYVHAGIPPGPIVMPDITAIDAVLNYEHHKYFYFVANIKKMGYHTFAKTLMQHNNNAIAYRRWVAKRH